MTHVVSGGDATTPQKGADYVQDQAGTFTLGDRVVKRLGYGAMQLAGPGVFGPPKDSRSGGSFAAPLTSS